MQQFVCDILKREEVNFDQSEIKRIVKNSEGIPRHALQLIQESKCLLSERGDDNGERS